ncbi:hypothetical protein L9F63_020291, partial [Diploptera punctata]
FWYDNYPRIIHKFLLFRSLGPSYVFKLTFFLNVRFMSHRPIPICGNSLDILSFIFADISMIKYVFWVFPPSPMLNVLKRLLGVSSPLSLYYMLCNWDQIILTFLPQLRRASSQLLSNSVGHDRILFYVVNTNGINCSLIVTLKCIGQFPPLLFLLMQGHPELSEIPNLQSTTLCILHRSLLIIPFVVFLNAGTQIISSQSLPRDCFPCIFRFNSLCAWILLNFFCLYLGLLKVELSVLLDFRSVWVQCPPSIFTNV